MSGEPIPIEHYARMRAEMDAGVLRDDVLARAGVSVEAWTTAQRAWLERMGSELERGRFELTQRYSQAFVERQRELARASAPRVAEPGHAPTENVPASPSAPAVADVVAIAPGPAPVAPLAAAGSAASSPWAQTPPLTASAPNAVPKQDLARTAGVDFAAVRAAALPFMHRASSTSTASPSPPSLEAQVAERAPSQPDSQNAAPKARPKFELGGTTAVDAAALQAAALPFMRGATGAVPLKAEPAPLDPASAPGTPAPPGAPGIPAQPVAPAPPIAVSKARPKFELGGTSAVDAEALRVAALPFMRNASGAAAASAGPAAPSSPAPSGAAAPVRAPQPTSSTSSALGATSALPPNLAELARSVLPFAGESKPAPAPSPATRPTELTLEQYASLCAELAAAPAESDAVFGRYGLHAPEVRAEVDRVWKERLRSNPSDYARWLDHYQRRQAQLAARASAK